jgi:hypothetical protein
VITFLGVSDEEDAEKRDPRMKISLFLFLHGKIVQ